MSVRRPNDVPNFLQRLKENILFCICELISESAVARRRKEYDTHAVTPGAVSCILKSTAALRVSNLHSMSFYRVAEHIQEEFQKYVILYCLYLIPFLCRSLKRIKFKR